jgi:hypothetical protein
MRFRDRRDIARSVDVDERPRILLVMLRDPDPNE